MYWSAFIVSKTYVST